MALAVREPSEHVARFIYLWLTASPSKMGIENEWHTVEAPGKGG